MTARVRVALAAAAALLVGGCGGSAEAEEVQAPQACLDALDHTRDLIDNYIQFSELTADSMGAAAAFDADGIDAVTAEIEALTPQTVEILENFNASAAACRNP